jgi:hypothetical protein
MKTDDSVIELESILSELVWSAPPPLNPEDGGDIPPKHLALSKLNGIITQKTV